MNRNQPFVCEMAFHIVHLHRAGETDKALNLRKQPQGMPVDDEQLHRAGERVTETSSATSSSAVSR